MAKWVRQHRRVEFVSYFSAVRIDLDLATKLLRVRPIASLITPLGTLP